MTNNFKFAFIYKLFLTHNPTVAYIGQTIDINSRYSQHFNTAKNIKNISNKLYFFMNFYGINNFQIHILKTLQDISPYNLNLIENYFIQLYGTLNTANANPNIVLTINDDIFLQFTNQLLDKPYTNHYISYILDKVNFKSTQNNTTPYHKNIDPVVANAGTEFELKLSDIDRFNNSLVILQDTNIQTTSSITNIRTTPMTAKERKDKFKLSHNYTASLNKKKQLDKSPRTYALRYVRELNHNKLNWDNLSDNTKHKYKLYQNNNLFFSHLL